MHHTPDSSNVGQGSDNVRGLQEKTRIVFFLTQIIKTVSTFGRLKSFIGIT